MRATLIPVTVRTRPKHEGPKVTIVTRIVMATTSVPVTVDTFNAYHEQYRNSKLVIEI